MKKLKTIVDVNGRVVEGIPTPDTVNAVALAASTAESITVPTGAKYVVFSSTGDFYANYSTTATIPGDTTDGSASELNPTVRELGPNDTISVISAATPIITAAFYAGRG